MAGLLDNDLLQMLGAGTAPLGANGGGLLGPASSGGGLMDALNSPQGRLGLGLLAASGPSMQPMGFGQRIAQGLRYVEDQNIADQKARALSLGTAKDALELQGLIESRKRDQAVNARLAGMNAPTPTASSPGPYQPGLLGAEAIGGVPMFSSGVQSLPRQDLLTQYGGGSGAAPSMAPSGAAPAATGGNQALYQRMIDTARLYAEAGDNKRALDIMAGAEKWKPKFNTTPQVMKDPRTGQLVNVLVDEDGNTRILPLGVKPDISIEDLGGKKQVIDRNAVSNGQQFTKTMTPGEVASNAVGWANVGNANSRLKLDREKFDLESNAPTYMQTEGGIVALPKRPQPGTAPVGQAVNGMDGQPLSNGKPLTEFQGKSTTYATRMQDAAKVIAETEGKSWPSTVNRSGYKPEFPNWVPGGQPAGALLGTINQMTVPAMAEKQGQAQENWVTANLRQESGAAIGKDEMAKEKIKWFWQPGESEALREQKASARRVAEQAMMVQAGAGAKLIPGTLEKAAAKDPQPGKAPMAQMPTPNASNKGRQIKDTETGKVYQSNGLQWKEVK